MTDLVKLRAANQKRWAAMTVHASLIPSIDKTARKLVAPEAKTRFLAVQKRTGVPWWFIAVVDDRETSERWNLSIAQGDPWNKVSRHVPSGRGPFKSWEDAAEDALVHCPPYAALNKDWSIGGALTMLERYNGLGYANKGVPSPYIWASTDQYEHGKYVADRVYDPKAVDHQIGCAALLKRMALLDVSVGVPASAPAKPAPKAEPKPVPGPLPTGKGAVVVAGSAAAAGAHWLGFSGAEIGFAVMLALIAAGVAAVIIDVHKAKTILPVAPPAPPAPGVTPPAANAR